MLPRHRRITREKDFAFVAKRGRRFAGLFSAVTVAKTELPYSRFAVSISKKVSKKASARNKTRRKITEFLRKQSASIIGGFDVVISLKNKAAEEPERTVEEIAVLLKETKVLIGI